MPPKAVNQIDRGANCRHTRRFPTNNLYAGLEYERPSKIRKKPLKVAKRICSNQLPPVATLHVPNMPFIWGSSDAPPAYVAPAAPVTTSRLDKLSDVLYQSRQNVFQYLSLSDYQSLRCCRKVATDFPAYTPFTPHINYPGTNRPVIDPAQIFQGQRRGRGSDDEHARHLDLRCEDRPLERTRKNPPGPGPASSGYVPYPTLPISWPHNPLPPAVGGGRPPHCNAVGAPPTGSIVAEYYKTCDGTRLGLNPNNQNHPASFTICNGCAEGNWWVCDLIFWFHARILPLCYECSDIKIRAGWQKCLCKDTSRYSHRPLGFWVANTDQGYHLCAKCRIDFSLQQEAMCTQKCINMGLPMRNPAALGHDRYIDDASLVTFAPGPPGVAGTTCSRNLCLCGKDTEGIIQSYPVIDEVDNQPDFAGMYRMCLLCDDHVQTIDEWKVRSSCLR